MRSAAVRLLDRVDTSFAEAHERGYAAGHRDAVRGTFRLVRDEPADVVQFEPYPGRHRQTGGR